MVILAVAAFVVWFTYHSTKGKSPGLLMFTQDMFLPINHIPSRKYIRQCKQAQIEKDEIRENSTIIK